MSVAQGMLAVGARRPIRGYSDYVSLVRGEGFVVRTMPGACDSKTLVGENVCGARNVY